MTPLRSMPYRAAGLLACALLLAPAGGRAAEPPDYCPTERDARTPATPPPADPPGTTFLRADTIRSPGGNVIELEGQAQIRRDGQRVDADYLRYRVDDEFVDARGDVSLTQPSGMELRTGEAHLDIDTRLGAADAGTYRLRGERQGRGDMAGVEFLGETRTRLFDVRYTTCPEGRDDWFLRASRIDLDTERDEGVARHARLSVFGVPLFYLPYFRFPISDARKSGFLVPQIGYGSELGATVATPYYLNLAPNYDATLTPRLLSERGVQLEGEFRYLGRAYGGRLDAEYLPDDDVTGDDRAAWSLVHSQAFNPRWSAFADVRRVSDRDYLSDFGERLTLTSETHLPQTAQVDYRGQVWSFTARAADYQTVDPSVAPADEPYARLPQLVLTGTTAIGPGRYSFASELVNFEHDAQVTGQRLNVAPSARWPLRRIYGFLTPEVGLRHIAYSLDEPAQTFAGTRPSVTAPFAALDTGLFFERELRIGEGYFDQTLEPRLYYLYTPFREQDDLPDFDTAVRSFGFGDFFRNRRFVGGDRIGDANQLSAALTTRFIEQQTGVERARASIGRIYYFDERRVNLAGEVIEDRASDIVGEAVARLGGGFAVTASAQWAADTDEAVRTNAYLRYRPAADRIVNLGYRFTRDDLEQIDVSAEWPLGARWTLRGRSLRSLRPQDRAADSENIHSYLGIEYRSCCWAVRVYGARTLVPAPQGSATATEQRGEVRLEFELSGLGQLGERFESPLREGPFASVP